MGIGSTVKTWWASASKNQTLSKIVASNSMNSVGRWAMGGAAIGGIQGAARRIAGERDASVTGGILSGALAGAGARGFVMGWKKAFGRGARGMAATQGSFAGVDKALSSFKQSPLSTMPKLDKLAKYRRGRAAAAFAGKGYGASNVQQLLF